MGLLDPPSVGVKVFNTKNIRSLLSPIAVLPSAMPSPPTFGSLTGYGSHGTSDTFGSTISGGVAIPFYKGASFANGIDTAKFTKTQWTLSNYFNTGVAVHPAGYTGSGLPTSVEFMYYGSLLELRMAAQSSAGIQFQMYVDEQPVSSSLTTVAGTVGTGYLLPVTFSGSALRKIRVEFIRNVSFGGVIIGATDFIAATDKGRGPILYAIGDSFIDGANGVGSLETYAIQMGKLLNCNTWVDGQGGTGLVANGGGGTKANYLPRIVGAGTEPRLKPDIVFIQGSTNDQNAASSVLTELPLCIAQVRSQWPSAKLVVTGLLTAFGPAGLGSTQIQVANHLKTVCTGLNPPDLFIDAYAEQWFTGNGKVGSTNGSGNSDIFMSNDSVHGSAAWHKLVGAMVSRRVIDYFASAV